eukprot:TRINITY_DN64883_c0_g1_i1.p1 TRINITY_DN64883_c0_g1~~TRINITY_DN64883_c0_g1_i1.p1  ORF type:complete len:213 (+),score=8.31 TRINITY_DN64883_c0_g1_i1:23-640(+)
MHGRRIHGPTIPGADTPTAFPKTPPFQQTRSCANQAAMLGNAKQRFACAFCQRTVFLTEEEAALLTPIPNEPPIPGRAAYCDDHGCPQGKVKGAVHNCHKQTHASACVAHGGGTNQQIPNAVFVNVRPNIPSTRTPTSYLQPPPNTQPSNRTQPTQQGTTQTIETSGEGTKSFFVVGRSMASKFSRWIWSTVNSACHQKYPHILW